MRPTNGSGPVGGDRGARKIRSNRRSFSLPPKNKQAVHAELSGSDRCTALGLTASGNAPVLTLARLLVGAGHDPDRPLDAYRGDQLCVRVRAIGEAAQLEPSPRGVGFVQRPAVRGGSPLRQNNRAAISVHGSAVTAAARARRSGARP